MKPHPFMAFSSLFIIFISVALVRTAEARCFDTEILRDLKGVRVVLNISEDSSKILSMNPEKIKEMIENELEQSGINLYRTDTTEFYMSGRPEMQIDFYPKILHKDRSIDFEIETAFVLTVRSFTNPKVTNRVQITYWRDNKCNGSPKDFFDYLDQHVEKFINSVCKAEKVKFADSLTIDGITKVFSGSRGSFAH